MIKETAMRGVSALVAFALLCPVVAHSQERACRDRLPADRTSLELRAADVATTIRAIAEHHRVSLVVTPDVTATVTTNIYDIPARDVFDTLLATAGLACVVRDGILVVSSADRIRKEAAEAREQARREEEARARAAEAKAKAEAEIRAKAAEAAVKEQEARELQARGPLKEETIRLAYADPEELAKTLQGLLGIPPQGVVPATTTPVVPPAGPPFSALFGPQPAPVPEVGPPPEVTAKGITIRAHKPTNSIFIRHYERDLERIKKLIRETLDIPLPQIKIEARLTELNRTDLFDIGVQWGGAGAARDGSNVLLTRGMATGPEQTSVSAVPFSGGVNPAANLALLGLKKPDDTNPAPTFLNTLIPAAGGSGLPLGGNLVNLPIGSAPAGAIGFGIIGTRFSVNLALQALESAAKARSLSRPEIVTLENVKAAISLGSEIPYATVSSAGTQVQFKEAVLKLEVTPTVIREADGTIKIKMKVSVDDNSRGVDVPAGNAGGTLPTINKRHAETEVVVREGAVLVIGGIAQRAETETVRKVPALGDVPIFGWLFKAKSRTTDPNRELVVFLTPTLVKDGPR